MQALLEFLTMAVMSSVLMALGGIPYFFYARSVRRELFALAARDLHLEIAQRGGGIAARSLSGTIDGFQVWVGEYNTGRFRNGLRVVVNGSIRRAGSVPGSLRAAAAVRSTGAHPAVPEGRFFTGDLRFDELVRLGGEAPVAIALLDHDTRQDLKRFLLRYPGARVEGGRIHADLPKGVGGGETLVELVREAVALAQRLVIETEAVPARLAHLAGSDGLPGVRRRALETLADAFSSSPEAAAALRAALGDEDEVVRATAAAGFGTELPGALHEMLERPRTAEAAAAAWALASLPGRFPTARVAPLAREASRDKRPVVRAAALRALAAVGDASCEAAALAALGSAEEELALAAVEALGAAGTVAAVPRLHERVAGHPFEFVLRRAVDAAVAAIRSRLPGAAFGQVSLAGDGATGGQVALAGAEDGSGRVGLAGDVAAGEVSLGGAAGCEGSLPRGTGDAAGRLSAATQG